MSNLSATLALVVPAFFETLYMAMAATMLAYAFGLPLGVILVISAPGHVMHKPTLNRVLGAVIDTLRSAPFIILLVALIPVTRIVVGTSIGSTAAIVPLVVSAAPFIARMVEAALKDVPLGVVEAAVAMGATPWQVVTKVLLPEARPGLALGVSISTISIIGYTAMAGAVGGGGLGDLAIQYGYNRFRTDIMIVTLVVLTCVVQLVQYLGNRLARQLDKR